MTVFTARLGGAAAAVLLGPAAATAAVTPEQVWQGWQDQIAEIDGTLTAAETRRENGRLVVSGVAYALAQEDANLSGTVEEIVFAEGDDGTVVIEMPEEYPLSLSMTDDDGMTAEMEISVVQSGMEMVASGEPDAIRYDYSADSIEIALDDFSGEAAEEATLDFAVALAGVSGHEFWDTGESKAFEGAFHVETADIDVTADERDGPGTMALDLTLQRAMVSASGAHLAASDAEDPAKAIKEGFRVSYEMGHGGSSYDFSFNEEGNTSRANGSAAEGGMSFSLGEEGMRYSGHSRASEITMSGSTLPMPSVEAAMDELLFELAVPVVSADTPQDFGTVLRLEGLTVGDPIWDMFDPDGTLPRDPARVVVDVDGRANWESDVLGAAAENPGKMMMQSPAALGALHELTLADLAVDALGARLTGDGAFTFDNTDTTTFPGMPRPEGSVTLELEGANALIDKLMAIGMISEDDAMGARMMMSMFARPGEGEDTLTSTLEVREDGSVLANGQRIQ